MLTRVLAVTALVAVTITACSSSKSDAKKFVGAAKQDAVATAHAITELLTEVGLLLEDDPSASADQLAVDAQSLHDHLGDFRSEILGAPGASGDDELDFINAENELKSAVGSILTWAGNPNPATLAKWNSQLTTALDEWNTAVNKLWPAAKVTPVPTISTA